MAYVGIDLGTINSRVAVRKDNGTVEIIRCRNGSRTIPSSVTFTDTGTLVGFESTNASQKHVHNTVYEAKRLIGQTYDQIKGHLESNMYPFKTLEQGGHPKIQIKRNNQDVLIGPEDVSAEVLKKLRLMAEENLKKSVRKAVITVPAYFMSSQRAATKAAARMAGFETVNIINEPTAAALVYHRNLPENKEAKILVYDFGGGTFDVSIVSIKNKNCKVLGIEGDVHLGGADIDMNLASFLKQDVMKKHGLKLAGSMAMKRLRSWAKEIKENLSTVDEYKVTMSNLCDDYVHTMTRDSFEKLNMEVFRKTLFIVRKCLQNVGLGARDIDDIVLVGGSSRIPTVRAILQTVFRGSNLNDTLNPDEAVAHGAAIYASYLANNLMETTFQDVVSLSLGIETQGDIMSPIIERNMEIPCEVTKDYTTSEPNQREVSVKIYQGERHVASKNNFLGNFAIENITPAPRGATKINVTFSLNSEGILTVAAEEESRGIGNRLVIRMDQHVVQNRDLNQRLTESAQTNDEDLRQVQLARRKIRFENFCEDLKASLQGTDEESRNYVIGKIDEVVRDNVDMEEMIRMEALLRISGNEVDDLKNVFKCREIAFNS